jgi:hypothetical protein
MILMEMAGEDKKGFFFRKIGDITFIIIKEKN